MRPCEGWQPFNGCEGDPGPYAPHGIERVWGFPVVYLVFAVLCALVLLAVAWWRDRSLMGPVLRVEEDSDDGPVASRGGLLGQVGVGKSEVDLGGPVAASLPAEGAGDNGVSGGEGGAAGGDGASAAFAGDDVDGGMNAPLLAVVHAHGASLGEGEAKVERWVFDPEEIRLACEKDLAAGLRAVADAVERGEVYGKFSALTPWGFTDFRDARVHLILKVHLAAEVFRRKGE